jgi:IclR family acetate operon transcriptional repressor
MANRHYLGTFLSETKVAGAAAFAKFMTVLQAVADAPHPPTAATLARTCGYPRPTVYRIIAALTEQGMVGETGGVYRLGTRLMSLASRAWSQFDLRAALAPELQALRDATGETVHLAVPAGHEMIYIDKLESPGPVRMVSRVGSSVALHSSAVGKAYLAALDEAARERLLRDLPLAARMPSTVTSLPALRAALGEAAARGYAMDNEENEPGIVCYGVALRDAAGRPVAGVSVSTLLFRRRDDPQAAYIEPLLRLRDAAAAKLAVLPVSSGGA